MTEKDLRKGPKPKNLIAAVSEGILGYILYQARCGIQEAYSEYLLYDPVVRIANDKEWKVEGEFTVEKIDGPGDNPKIDFLFTSKYNSDIKVGLEVKYLKNSMASLSIKKDTEKLNKLMRVVSYTKLLGFILVAGRHTEFNAGKIEKEKLKRNLKDYYKVDFKNQFGVKYGVTVLKACEERSK